MQQEETVNRKLRPLIKWTGGKYEEYSKFSQLIPGFNNYYEPFFGGGGVFFALQPKKLSFLNDKSQDLFTFYQLFREEKFKKQLAEYVTAWDQATTLSKLLAVKLLEAFQLLINEKIEQKALEEIVLSYLNNISDKDYNTLFDPIFIIDVAAFKKLLIKSIIDKFKRIGNIQKNEKKSFSTEELKQHIETGVKSGLYLYLREVSNKVVSGQLKLSVEKATANWYFVREFCYASMFRFNKKGEFNIPYGGIAYNNKNFRAKACAITSSDTANLFKNASFYNLDFQEFLEQTRPDATDFVFLDPPYDSEFSEYDQNAFTKDDQVRLRDSILKCKAKCMVVIKETEFIRQLYDGSTFNIVHFDKTYTYNVRGRNNRGTKHLVIINY